MTMTDDDPSISESESSDLDMGDLKSDSAESAIKSGAKTRTSVPRRLSVSARSGVVTIVIACLVGAVSVMSWLYIRAQNQLDTQARRSQDYSRAEKIAVDYAVNAAAMDYHDLSGWKAKLVAGTTPELKGKLTKAATSMEQILIPLHWDSTAEPLVAKVGSETSGVYTVDSFVSVLTKTVQAPDGLQSTAMYSITIDSNKDWQISGVGGVSSLVNRK